MDRLLDIINIILKNREKPTLDKISGETDLRTDLGFDSLDLAELTARIEAEYDVDIFEDGIVFKISDIWEKISK
ncbi:MAG: acyl carrier protein [Opitutales bacterium]|jgi:acyl carrier protein|nr:acyl carrier protein [Opitutales bacterium]